MRTNMATMLRLGLSLLLTGVLPYVLCRVVMVRILAGMPEPLFAGLLVVIPIGIVLLNRDLADRLPMFWRRGCVAVLVVGWIAAHSAIVLLTIDEISPKAPLLVLHVLGTFWLLWLSWMFFFPRWSARRRWIGFVLCVLLAVPFPAFFRYVDLTGDAQVRFAWRWQSTAPVLIEHDFTSPEPIVLVPTESDYWQYLGPGRTAEQSAVRLDRDWKAHPPRLRWKREVGSGWGAFAFVGDHAFTQEQRGDDECVVCYHVGDGRECWIHRDRARFESRFGGDGPRATPTVQDGRLYSVGSTGICNCLNAANGTLVWTVNILEDNNAENLIHGVCGSPLLHNDLVLVAPTGKGGPSLAAYDKETGKRRWAAGNEQSSYSSPTIGSFAGLTQILNFATAGLMAHEPVTGTVLWEFPWTNGERINCSQPLVHAGKQDHVFLSTGYGGGCAYFRVARDPSGLWWTDTLWTNRNMKNKFCTSVVHENHVYGLDDGILACVGLRDGSRRWKGGRYQHGQILRVHDLLVVQAENGDVVLVQLNPDRLVELGRSPGLAGKTWNNPVLVSNLLLLRNDREAVCLELPIAK